MLQRLLRMTSSFKGELYRCGSRRWYGGAAQSMVQHPDDPLMDLPDWAGADREALVYRSLEDFTPVGVMQLNGALFNAPVRRDLMSEAVLWQRARWRAGLASSKSRGDVDRTGRKPWRQKGTGRARHSSRSSPIWVGGGVSHGPKPRDWSYKLNRKAWRLALRSTLSMKFANGRLWVIETPELSSHKTTNLKQHLSRLRWRSALIIDDAPLGHWGATWNLAKAVGQVPGFQVMSVNGLNVHDLVLFNHVVLTQRVVAQIEKRFERYTGGRFPTLMH